MKRTLAILLTAASFPALAQLTPDQKIFEFQLLASVYSKYYAPYQWKLEVMKFDALDIKPWLERVRATKDDLDFYEVCSRYVTSLNDTHSSFLLPSAFSASLGFGADIYDGKIVIDSISRGLLPASRFNFAIGDELLSIDGRPVSVWLEYLKQFTALANPRSTQRLAAARLTSRSQESIPRAHEIGAEAIVEIRRRADGVIQTYTIPWNKFGTPLTKIGPVPSPNKSTGRRSAEEEPTPPGYMRPLLELQRDEIPALLEVLNLGSTATVWRLPAGFQQRPTGSAFVSGSYTAEDKKIGFIRIPNFSPGSTTVALRQFETEIAWMQENTDGLIVDVMRNPGGDGCYNEEIQRRLIPYNFRGIGREIRATRNWVNAFSDALDDARAERAEPHVIALLEIGLRDVMTAYSEYRGRTGALSICSESLDRVPAAVVYSKPLMVLTDEFSMSAADAFPAVLQDAGRALLFGMRTNGAGGTVGAFRFGVFSEAMASATIAMHQRSRPVVTPEYPTAPYVENIGVRPDIEYDYMTMDNLLNGGRHFVESFTAAMLEHIRRTR